LTEVRFYFDESVDLAVSEQLALAGLDVVSAHSLDTLGDEDPEHLRRATAMARVLCTCDADFLVLAQHHTEHAGIVFGAMQRVTIGDWVHYVRRLHAQKDAQDVRGLVFYVERR
jgi:predicted nuclease of predicted toxin-antitoxin system